MLEVLERAFQRVYDYFHSERFERAGVYAHYHGHETMQFDHDAEQLIIDELMTGGLGFEVITEERPPFATVSAPAYRIVIDPVDGSENVKRGIMTAGVALAVLPPDGPIAPERVEWAFVGEVFSGTVYHAQRGAGAFCNGKPCYVSQTTRLRECVVGLNCDDRDNNVIRALLTQEPRPARTRRTGSSAIDSVLVASGAYDAYIDVGEVLTAESFLASAGIVLEAGGHISDQNGQPLRPIVDLAQGFSLLVTGTGELQQEIVARIARSS
jgi:myo-inositol-1(or 4)-monophosphatase